MSSSFSERVSSAQWRAEAEEWIAAVLEHRGRRITAPILQPRVRPWSTQLTIETDAGRVWFKANQPAFGFEPALQAVMARLVPGSVQEPLAVDRERHWMLTEEHGPPMADTDPPTAAEWIGLVREAARIQRVLVSERETLLDTGLPDCSPETVLERFDSLRAVLRSYDPGHPGHLDPETDARLGSAREELARACAELSASPLPSTWNHGDLHPYNAYRDSGEVRLFDLGDGQWAHASEVLAVPFDWMRRQGLGGVIEPATAAYLDEWRVPPAALAPRATRIVHAVNRAQTWWAWLDDTSPDELERFGREPEEHLSSILAEMHGRPGAE